MEKKYLDLRGLSCPQPVLETKNAIDDRSFDSFEILIDTRTSLENIQRLLSTRGDLKYTVDEGEDFKVNISRI
ncbi:MAG: SirA-like protein [Syntrophorhabdus sp. PtaU1.Bin058]|nr:MAG: SirA-like protein [Syntrophorhabdus sp. PtaU1.Bin058]